MAMFIAAISPSGVNTHGFQALILYRNGLPEEKFGPCSLSRGNGANELQHGSTHFIIRGVDAHDVGDMIVSLELSEARTVFILRA